MAWTAADTESERSPLLRAMRNSYQEDSVYMPVSNYLSTDNSEDASLRGIHVFRPIVYAEKALGVLLNSVTIYVFCCILGLGLVCINADGVLGPGRNWNWCIVFLPFWIGNVIVIIAHIASMRSATMLRQWAETDCMSNEPLLPLLRKILLIYAVSVPLFAFLLWSELAFCAILTDMTYRNTSVYFAFAPILGIEAAYIARYLLCKARSTLPGCSWVLIFVFTLMLAYNADIVHRRDPETEELPGDQLPWFTVFCPIFVWEFLMFCSLVIVLYSQAAGYYSMGTSQLTATVLYTIALIAGAIGHVMLLEHMELESTSLDVPSILLFSAWVTGSLALYIISRQEVNKLMATRGGAVPVPLTRTDQGWVTNYAVTDPWMLLGDIPLTSSGLKQRGQRKRTSSTIENDFTSQSLMCLRQLFGSRLCSFCCCLSSRQSFDSNTSDHPEGRLKNVKRKNSGSYSDFMDNTILKMDLSSSPSSMHVAVALPIAQRFNALGSPTSVIEDEPEWVCLACYSHGMKHQRDSCLRQSFLTQDLLTYHRLDVRQDAHLSVQLVMTFVVSWNYIEQYKCLVEACTVEVESVFNGTIRTYIEPNLTGEKSSFFCGIICHFPTLQACVSWLCCAQNADLKLGCPSFTTQKATFTLMAVPCAMSEINIEPIDGSSICNDDYCSVSFEECLEYALLDIHTEETNAGEWSLEEEPPLPLPADLAQVPRMELATFIDGQGVPLAFKPLYYRNNKKGGIRNMRCFPQCKRGAHTTTSFCGDILRIHVQFSHGAQTRIHGFARFRSVLDHSPALRVGMILNPNVIYDHLRSKERPKEMWMHTKPIEYSSPTHVIFEIRPSERSLSWHYGFNGPNPQVQKNSTHYLEIGFFVDCPASQFLCIGVAQTPHFRIASSRTWTKD
ncbi:hypothetical protein THRCLA_05780 [Thraustotheca clavata]|uniref:Transmembrane protein n=1 Tax=Thraustotheca clavata TaxID=74557 RepID=A0A1V9ZST5_9STRA|nr:hypothetical protein THRCLA_05780 [Thraustotheca clavata]